MRWTMGRRSDNVEDRRGSGPGMPLVAGGGIGSIILVLVALYFGVDPSVVLQGGGQPPPTTQAPAASSRGGDDQIKQFVSVVLADTEDTWRQLFRRMNREYRDPTLVLFTGSVQSACGMAGAAVGPFYCPGDQKLYLDTSFFRDLRDRFGAPGDFAQAYVIAHEVGHHVQTLLGISERVQAARRRGDTREANALSVRMELQADCFAGVWAHHAAQDPPHPRGRRPRRGARRRHGHRRRPAADARAAGARRPRKLHPRLLGAARPVVPPRLRLRRNPPVRHVRLEPPRTPS